MKSFDKIFTLLLLVLCSIQMYGQTCSDTEIVGIVGLNTSNATIGWEANPDAVSYNITIERNNNVEVNYQVVPLSPVYVDYDYIISPNAFGPNDYLVIDLITTCANGFTSTAHIEGFIGSLVTVEEVYAGKDANNVLEEDCNLVKEHWVKPGTRFFREINKNTFGNTGEGPTKDNISNYRWIKPWNTNEEGREQLRECWLAQDFTNCLTPVYNYLWQSAKSPNICTQVGEGFRLSLLESSISPNPISKSATLNFSLETKNQISIALYDIQGKMVESFVNNEKFEAGPHFIQIERGNLATGLYHLKISSNEINEMIKVIITK